MIFNSVSYCLFLVAVVILYWSLPRTARLKVVWEKDDAAVPNFRFRVVQGGEQVGGIQSTFAADMENAKGESGSAGGLGS